jgi:hypothetical protein
VRVLAGDLVGDDAVLQSLCALREQIAAQRARFDVAEEVAATLPHPARYLRLVHLLGRALLDAHDAWLDAVERELARPDRGGSAPSA